MSLSSADSTSSGLTSGRVLLIGIVKPFLTAGALDVPGLTSMNMSLSPVLERSSAVASSRRKLVSYSASMSRPTIARPSLSVTDPMSPILTPATRTVCPWPGVTAWAVENSALTRIGFSSMKGKRRRWFSRM